MTLFNPDLFKKVYADASDERLEHLVQQHLASFAVNRGAKVDIYHPTKGLLWKNLTVEASRGGIVKGNVTIPAIVAKNDAGAYVTFAYEDGYAVDVASSVSDELQTEFMVLYEDLSAAVKAILERREALTV